MSIGQFSVHAGFKIRRPTFRFMLKHRIDSVNQLLSISLPSGSKKKDQVWAGLADLRDALKESGFNPDKYPFLVSPI